MTRPGPRLFDYPVRSVDAEIPDGDTVDLHAWLTRYQSQWMRVRVLAIDAPEIRTEHGPLFRAAVLAWCFGRTLRVTTREEDSFGRPLGDIYDAVTGEHLDTHLTALARTLGISIVYAR